MRRIEQTTQTGHIRNQIMDMIRDKLEEEGTVAVVEPLWNDTILLQTFDIKKHIIVEDAP